MGRRRYRRDFMLYGLEFLLIILFAALIIALSPWLRTQPWILMAALILPLSLLHATARWITLYRLHGGWEELARITGFQTVLPRHQDRLFFGALRKRRLDPMQGTHHGHRVLVDAEPIQHSSSIPRFLRALGSGVYTTNIRLEPHEVDPELQLKLERRRVGQKTDTRLDEKPAGQSGRSGFEKDHHLFTNDPDEARRLLSRGIQKGIEDLEGFEVLRIEDSKVSIELEGVLVDPEELRQALGVLKQLTDRLLPSASGVAPPRPQAPATAPTNPPAPGADPTPPG